MEIQSMATCSNGGIHRNPKSHFHLNKNISIFKPTYLYSSSNPQSQPGSGSGSESVNPKFVITGPTSLSGHVNISGSKNSSLPILAATLCCSTPCRIRNVPNLSDTASMLAILTSLGARLEAEDIDGILVNPDGITSVEPKSTETERTRGGFLVIGPLLGRFGEAVVGLPGGCDIGSRPVDLHLKGLRALGAVVDLRDGKVMARAGNGRGLIGAKFRLDFPSVGATETLMMAASLADGTTELSNVAREPEVVDLARFLNRCGSQIAGAGTGNITIKGNRRLSGSDFAIIPDRIEAGSFMIAAAITRSCLSLSPVVPSQLQSLIGKLSTAGCEITQIGLDSLEVSAVQNLQGFNIKTSPFPGFPTDLQPQTMALLATATGLSVVEESVFEKRMGHAMELQKLGAKIQVEGSRALVYGLGQESGGLRGTRVIAGDLRGGMALVLAGLAAEGTTEIDGVVHIDRGYENLESKFLSLGAHIKRL